METIRRHILPGAQSQYLHILPQSAYPHNKHKFYWLSGRKIISIAKQNKYPTNPFQSFASRIKSFNDNNTPYFDINEEQFQQTINRLNIQTRLSKKQLNEQDVNGYRKIKVNFK